MIERLSILRRLRYAWTFREWPWRIPPEAALIGTKRPPEHVFEEFRRLHGLAARREQEDGSQ